MLRAAAMVVGLMIAGGGAVAVASPAPAPAAHDKGGHKDEHKAAAPAAAPADKAATTAVKPEKTLPGKIPALNTVVETGPARAKKELGKTDDGSPTLNVSALRDEVKRGGVEEDRPGSKKYAERLEQLTRDLNKAREGLREETARLEALMANGAGVGGGGGGGAEGETVKKTPAPLDVVAKAIRGMKPEQAGPVVSRMDKKLAADVLQRMPAADAGKVMGQLKPETAAELAAEIASRGPRAEARR